jgi:NADH-quinone oxidoreductase subunit L
MEGSNLIWLVLFLPLAGFLLQAFAGARVVRALGPDTGKRVMGTLAVLPIAIGFGIGAWLTFQLAQLPVAERSIVLTLFSWISIASIDIPFEVVIDPLSMTMVLIITGIGALIHLYATAYMAEDRDYTRFFTYLNLFIVMMLVLVLGNNLALMFIGWEGVGVCSYLLIGFWYKDLANAKAANKAFIVNRIGDWGLTLGMFLLMLMIAGNAAALGDGAGARYLSFDVILQSAGMILENQPVVATAIALLLFVGAMGKSAQFPLYLWLPDAMAGPTPVSALIHAATMVTAGVFMLNRLHVIFELSPIGSAVIVMVGAFTALFAALIAFGQTDIKKVLAYSTVSQLGFMFIGCGAGAYWTGMFHVTTHAFFKALLFLGAGAVIYAMAHNQDLRNYGNLRKYLPITTWTMVAGFLAIAGFSLVFFGFAGFYSKESILGAALANDHARIDGLVLSQAAGWIGLGVAALTAMYMTRLTWLTFFGTEERWRSIPAHAHHHDEHGVAAMTAEHGEATPTPYQHVHAGATHEEIGADHPLEDHGPDEHGPDDHRFFFTDQELHQLAQSEIQEHGHHDLDETHTPHEVPASMAVPLVVLAVLSVFGGWLLYNNHLFEHWLYPQGLAYLGEVNIYPQGIPLLWLSMAASFGGIIAGVLVYRAGLPKKEGWDEGKWHPFRRSASQQFGFDSAMVNLSVEGGRDLALAVWEWIDVKLIDGTVNGLGAISGGLGAGLRRAQTGFVRFYALVMLIGAVGLLGYFAYVLFTINGGAG